MDRDFVGEALARVQIARFRRKPDFGIKVESAMREILTQPFGKPLEVARAYSFTKELERRAVWSAVVKRLEESPPEPSPKPSASQSAIRPSQPDPSSVRYCVGLLTDVGPDTPGATLRDLASEGAARVEVLRQGPKTPPLLLYYVAKEHASPELDALRYAEPGQPMETSKHSPTP